MANVAELEEDTTEHHEPDSAVVRFAGDSGDGMQLTGSQFTLATALAGQDLTTFPDFPAEIRAPAGTTFGVSAFQINFGARNIMTAGDAVDVLVVMNPAAMKVNIEDLKPNGVLIADSGAFTERNVLKAGYAADPLDDEELRHTYRVVTIDMSRLTLEAVKEHGISQKDGLRCKNMWALGLVYWMYGRKRADTADWLNTKFGQLPDIAAANIAALDAGHAFGETAEMPAEIGIVNIGTAAIEPGLYRTVTGTESVAWGLVAGAELANVPMVFCSYPITPATSILHTLARMKDHNVVTYQAEDEIAAAAAAIGVSYAGSLGVTSSSGPGIALKGEAIGLAVGIELPLVVVNTQRAGPSTGMPTKTEQSDLWQAVYGRNGDAPLPVLSISSPTDGFDMTIEAVRIATKYMTPVILLSDGYIANASEPWRIPDFDKYDRFDVAFRTDPENFLPFSRDDKTLARPWVKPGTAGLMHRIGGIERDEAGNISYDADNHQRMTDLRRDKIAGIADDIPPQSIDQGDETGKIAIVGWGSTYGPISRATHRMRDQGFDVSHIHLNYIWPMPRNVGDLLAGFEHVLVPEMNTGQLLTLLRSEYLVPATGLNKVTGKPFKIAEIEAAAHTLIED